MIKKVKNPKWNSLGCGEGIIYCDNMYCESPAFSSVVVSEDKAGDSTRNFCAPCAEAYAIGVRHGSLGTLEDLCSTKRKRSRASGEKLATGAVVTSIGNPHALP